MCSSDLNKERRLKTRVFLLTYSSHKSCDSLIYFLKIWICLFFLTRICGFLNMGTFSPAHAEAMFLAGKKAKSMGKSVILDPVGVGISRLRREAIKRILEEIGPDIVKGNFSEMAFLAGEESRSRGVDVSEEDARKDGLSIALKVYQKWGCVAAVTGKTDIVVFQNKAVEIYNGHPALKKMTGTGCITGGTH